jgi:hypothetical protein
MVPSNSAILPFFLFFFFKLGSICCSGGIHCDNSEQVYIFTLVRWLPPSLPLNSLIYHWKQLQDLSLFCMVYEVHQPFPLTVISILPFFFFFLFFLAVLGFELRAYTLSHSTSPSWSLCLSCLQTAILLNS